MSKFLDSNGVAYLWTKIKLLLAGKVDSVDGKGLSSNDFSDTYKNKLSGIADGANKYTHPSYTSHASGFFKVAIDTQGHVSEATAVSKDDITGLGIPAQDTTYSVATTSAAGLMSDTDKVKLNGVATGANNYSLPTATSSVLGGVKVGGNITNSSGTISLTKANVTSALGYTPPTANTTYGVATSSANGLMASTDKAKLDGFAAASTYALKSDLTNVYKYQGSVATLSKLPTSSTAGYVYNVEENGMNYAWNGTEWDSLGELFSIESITNTEIDTIFAS